MATDPYRANEFVLEIGTTASPTVSKITGLGGSLRGVAGGYAGIGYLAATGSMRTALIAGALLLVSLIIGLVIYWRRFEYRVGSHEIRIDSGIISRTHRSIPFDRVQDVDVEQGPLARLLGLAQDEAVDEGTFPD